MALKRAAPIALALALLPACGGSDKQDYASKADAICAKSNRQINAFGRPTTLSELANTADKTLPVLDHTISELARLEAPPSQKALAGQWLSEVRKLKDDLRQIGEKAKTGDMQGVRSIVPQASRHNSRSNALATQLGMSVCDKD